MKIALIGYGTMGRLTETLAMNAGDEIAVAIGANNEGLSAGELAEKLMAAEVAIDFTTAGAVKRNVEACLLAGVPLVEGTTGWNGQIDEIRELVAASQGALIFGANFSVGVNLFYRVVDYAAELMARSPDYEAFIAEQHHNRKKDAPSGTALKLKGILAEHIKREIPVTAMRVGHTPGTHTVGFDGRFDQITFTHAARSREGFASGALLAARWIRGKTGFWEFSNVMEEILRGNSG